MGILLLHVGKPFVSLAPVAKIPSRQFDTTQVPNWYVELTSDRRQELLGHKAARAMADVASLLELKCLAYDYQQLVSGTKLQLAGRVIVSQP